MVGGDFYRSGISIVLGFLSPSLFAQLITPYNCTSQTYSSRVIIRRFSYLLQIFMDLPLCTDIRRLVVSSSS